MTTQTTGESTADRQRARSARGIGRPAGGAQVRRPSPPRQRRPALAALAVLMIVGGALVAGLLALQMNERVPVLAASGGIPAGGEITADNVRVVHVAADREDVAMIPESQLGELLEAGAVARTRIAQGQLITESLLVQDGPLASGDFAMVSVLRTPGLVPKGTAEGDRVLVVRAAPESGTGRGRTITEGYVMSRTGGASDGLGGGSAGSLTLLVPQEAAQEVVDAAGANRAGLAILERDVSLDGLSLSVESN